MSNALVDGSLPLRRAKTSRGSTLSQPLAEATVNTPLGPLTLRCSASGLLEARFLQIEPTGGRPIRNPLEVLEAHSAGDAAADTRLSEVVAALTCYFAGECSALDAVPIQPRGTLFQQQVWQALRQIPPGATQSYGEVARAIQNINAVRAVGTACGANPVVLFVPCHRVVAARRKLGGFSAGLWRKELLLAHEGSMLPRQTELRIQY